MSLIFKVEYERTLPLCILYVSACNDTGCSQDKWLSRLESSNWLSHVDNSLNVSCLVAQCLDQEGASVLVHGTQGMDSTPLVTSVAQVILNPDCRTVRGLQALVEREWLQAGYPFQTRHAKFCYSTARNKSQQPTFLLFLDCVHQLHYQFPCSFEYTTQMLILLYEHSYFSQFGKSSFVYFVYFWKKHRKDAVYFDQSIN